MLFWGVKKIGCYEVCTWSGSWSVWCRGGDHLLLVLKGGMRNETGEQRLNRERQTWKRRRSETGAMQSVHVNFTYFKIEFQPNPLISSLCIPNIGTFILRLSFQKFSEYWSTTTSNSPSAPSFEPFKYILIFSFNWSFYKTFSTKR